MKLDTVDWGLTFGARSVEVAFDARTEAARDRYDLATAIRVVRRMDTSASRRAVFAEIKSKNPLYRMVDVLYSMAGARLLQPFLLLLYMIKCAVSVGPFNDDGAEAVAISSFENERRAVGRVAKLVPDARIMPLSIHRRHLLAFAQFGAAFRMLCSVRRLWPFLSRLARSHSFMPAARVASALAYYIRFSQLFSVRPGLNTAIVASNYSPEAMGLAAAAHRMNRRVIYANHAPVPANCAVIPPVLADCAIFYGKAIQQTYERLSRCTAEVALIGQPGAVRPMEWRKRVSKVGIFLTALTRSDAVAALVAAIAASRPGAQILIRNHPVALLKSDFADIVARHRNVEVTIGNPLDEEIAECDLIFCGNSGVALNALRGGRPVAYAHSLDELSFDYNGFVSSGLLCAVTGWSEDLYARLKAFYANAAWQEVMQSYDASYGADSAILQRTAAVTIRRYLRPTLGRGSAAFPVQSDALPSFLAPI